MTLTFIQGSLLIFHLCTLQDYHTGGLFLPIGNAISDGSVPLIGILIILGFIGNGVMTEDFIGNWSTI